MPNKIIRVSKIVDTTGSGNNAALARADYNWKALPGADGSMSREALEIDDSILGQVFRSQQVGLVSWSIEGSAIYKGFAGYVATLKNTSGASIVLAATATTKGVPGTNGRAANTYQITDDTKRLLDFDTPVVVNVGGSVTNLPFKIDYLGGIIEFTDAIPSTVVTVAGKYFNASTLGRGMTFTLNMSADSVENTDFQTAQSEVRAGNTGQPGDVPNEGTRTHQYGLKTVGLDITGIHDTTTDFPEVLTGRERTLVIVNPDGSRKSEAIGYYYLVNQGQSGEVGALEEETLTYSLSVPSSQFLPFNWYHTSDSTLHDSAKICLDAWVNEKTIRAQYLYDGVNGWEGDVIVTEASLEGGLDVMNTFGVTLMGTGAHEIV